MMKRSLSALAVAAALLPASAMAQSVPSWTSYGYVPSAGDLRSAFGSKQDLLNYTPLSLSGGTMRGKLYTQPSTINGSGFSILPGIAPTAPANGDMWVTSAGFFVQVNGQTQTLLNGSNVVITGGTIDGTAIGSTTPSTGAFTTLSATTPLAAASGGTGYGSVSSALDGLFSSTQGAILYRGPAAWQALAPGTSGQVLTTPGVGANPAWTFPASITGTVVPPQGRLTLTSGVAVLSSTVSAATSVIYTPSSAGNLVPLWNGSSFVMTACPEYAQALSDTTYSPSAAAAANVYDEFAWNSGGTCRVTRGPAWSAGATAGSNLARGAGAGSTALARSSGLLTNSVAITNGPAAGYGTYVGTIATDAGGATVTFKPNSSANGGGGAFVGLWNAYNRVPVSGIVVDTSGQWQYSSTSFRSADASSGNRVTFVTGLQDDPWKARYTIVAGGNNSGYTSIGVGFNSTTTYTGYTGYTPVSAIGGQGIAEGVVQPLGSNYLQALEAVSAGTTSFDGASAYTTPPITPGLLWEGRY